MSWLPYLPTAGACAVGGCIAGHFAGLYKIKGIVAEYGKTNVKLAELESAIEKERATADPHVAQFATQFADDAFTKSLKANHLPYPTMPSM